MLPARQDKVWLTGTTLTYTVELQNTGQATDQFDLELSPSAWAASVWDGTFSQPLTRSMAIGACQTQTLGLAVTVPPTVEWNVTNVVTLTARSQDYPGPPSGRHSQQGPSPNPAGGRPSLARHTATHIGQPWRPTNYPTTYGAELASPTSPRHHPAAPPTLPHGDLVHRLRLVSNPHSRGREPSGGLSGGWRTAACCPARTTSIPAALPILRATILGVADYTESMTVTRWPGLSTVLWVSALAH